MCRYRFRNRTNIVGKAVRLLFSTGVVYSRCFLSSTIISITNSSVGASSRISFSLFYLCTCTSLSLSVFSFKLFCLNCLPSGRIHPFYPFHCFRCGFLSCWILRWSDILWFFLGLVGLSMSTFSFSVFGFGANMTSEREIFTTERSAFSMTKVSSSNFVTLYWSSVNGANFLRCLLWSFLSARR